MIRMTRRKMQRFWLILPENLCGLSDNSDYAEFILIPIFSIYSDCYYSKMRSYTRRGSRISGRGGATRGGVRGKFWKIESNFVRFPGIYSQPRNAALKALGSNTEHRRHLKRRKWKELLIKNEEGGWTDPLDPRLDFPEWLFYFTTVSELLRTCTEMLPTCKEITELNDAWLDSHVSPKVHLEHFCHRKIIIFMATGERR